MTRINTNMAALIGARLFNTNNAKLTKTLERLSTGYRINRGSDDPAGLIASENLRADQASIQAAITSANRASAIVGTAEGALTTISDKLTELQSLVSAAASTGGLTQDEIDANQTQVDSIVASINRIASETSFQGTKLLDGSQGFTYSAAVANVTDVEVRGAKISADLSLAISCTASARV
ncbi:MAG: flagellin, partial [Planctomycetes bacterium]|nr:flagellin [Planctomycetota bacterium]